MTKTAWDTLGTLDMPSQTWLGLMLATNGPVHKHLKAAKLTRAERRGRIPNIPWFCMKNQGQFKEKHISTYPKGMWRNLVAKDGEDVGLQQLCPRCSKWPIYTPVQYGYGVVYSTHWIFIFLCRFLESFLPPVSFSTQEGREAEEKAENRRECGCEGVYVCFGFKTLAWKEIFALTEYKRCMIFCTEKVRNSCNVNTVHWKLKGGVLFLGAK